MKTRKLELLAPAANAGVAIEAIKHGADAIYMGATSHGARKSASNSLDDIARVVDFAHIYRSKVYVTVNTIIYEDELKKVESLCHDLYRIGVDALIVQDMALLRMNLPPVPLHASTQCDIRTPQKARFLQEAGFSQLVLARELTLHEIKDIVEAVDIPVECFIHGALCVSYSGRCHASFAANGRSANRGECAQLCRLPYDLYDGNGKQLARNKHLLSLKDFNSSLSLPDLVEAGVSSFKIEGRLKDADYVKNITAFYSNKLNDIIRDSEGLLERSSFGSVNLRFTPQPEKSFNRGFTDYFLTSRRPEHIASLLTPKSMGELVMDVNAINNGDGISFFDCNGIYQGVNVNRVEKGKILTAKKIDIPRGTEIHRTFDVEWQKTMAKETAVRKIRLDIEIDDSGVTAKDERGVAVRLPLDVTKEEARNVMDYKGEFSKLGNTPYMLGDYQSKLDNKVFIPRSELSSLRRDLIDLLDKANLSTYPLQFRRNENRDAVYPLKKLDYRDNVANSLAEEFYKSHGVVSIEKALEVSGTPVKKGKVVMTTRHCVLREIGLCRRLAGRNIKTPVVMTNGKQSYRLHFNCADCEMEVLTD